MSGIYIHIPYCKKVCNYCDFHFSASLRNKEQMIDSICYEISLQKNYLTKEPIETLYFGGGTPSILSLHEIEKILATLHKNRDLSKIKEFTFEVNPDDLTQDYLNGLQSMGVNRLSIGIQSFSDSDLQWMNRRHNTQEGLNSIKLAQSAGFNNINIDLIYGLPYSSIKIWEDNLNIFHSLDIPHLSAYHLTIEPKTVLGVMEKKGKVKEISEENSIDQYKLLLEKTDKWNYLNYEISNFCRENLFSHHNLNYWNNGQYLGLGPSAHSFNLMSRQWNISVNQTYIDKLRNGELWYEQEILTDNDRFNDYLLTRLRTIWGIDIQNIKDLFGEHYYAHLLKEVKEFEINGLIIRNGNHLSLSQKGKWISNHVISGLMYVD